MELNLDKRHAVQYKRALFALSFQSVPSFDHSSSLSRFIIIEVYELFLAVYFDYLYLESMRGVFRILYVYELFLVADFNFESLFARRVSNELLL